MEILTSTKTSRTVYRAQN